VRGPQVHPGHGPGLGWSPLYIRVFTASLLLVTSSERCSSFTSPKWVHRLSWSLNMFSVWSYLFVHTYSSLIVLIVLSHTLQLDSQDTVQCISKDNLT
jgi:hypothetical protein